MNQACYINFAFVENVTFVLFNFPKSSFYLACTVVYIGGGGVYPNIFFSKLVSIKPSLCCQVMLLLKQINHASPDFQLKSYISHEKLPYVSMQVGNVDPLAQLTGLTRVVGRLGGGGGRKLSIKSGGKMFLKQKKRHENSKHNFLKPEKNFD